MPKITVSRHGLTAAIPPTVNPNRVIGGLRGVIGGWSSAATRRNTAFLRQIDETRLTGAGVAITLTLRDCPPTSDDWHRLRRAWIKRMERAGMIRLHWVTEWQRRGVPHLHCAIWFPDLYDTITPKEAWIDLAGELYGAGYKGQHGRIIDGPVGWFQYLSKHAARGVAHYQRSKDGIPEAWQERTGRVWGHVGEWPLQEPVELSLEGSEGDRGWFVFRRLVRSWRIADARQYRNRHRIAHARRLLRAPRSIAEVRGVSEWIPRELARSMLEHVAALGYAVRPYVKASAPAPES